MLEDKNIQSKKHALAAQKKITRSSLWQHKKKIPWTQLNYFLLGMGYRLFLISYILVKKYRDNCCIAIVWVPNIPSIHTVLQTCGIRHCQSHMQSFQYTSFFYLAIQNSVGKYRF